MNKQNLILIAILFLVIGIGCATTEISEWEKAKRDNTIKAYKRYLSKYPNGSFAKKAKKNLEVLKILKTLKFSFQLEKLLEKYPEECDLIVPELENRIMNEIKDNGVKNRFVIKGIPITIGKPCRITMICTATHWYIFTEFPGDRLDNVNIFDPFNPFNPFDSFDSFDKILDKVLCFTPGTIHRFKGKIPLIEGYTIIGEGDKLHRLTFGVIKNVGYVYLRGKGRVILKNGKEIKLGY